MWACERNGRTNCVHVQGQSHGGVRCSIWRRLEIHRLNLGLWWRSQRRGTLRAPWWIVLVEGWMCELGLEVVLVGSSKIANVAQSHILAWGIIRTTGSLASGNTWTLEFHYVTRCRLKSCCIALCNISYMKYLFQLCFFNWRRNIICRSVFTVSCLPVQNG